MDANLSTDVHWSELSTAVRRDLIFGDFFNKFCCLPIFGQKLAYVLQFDKFILDPPPLRGAHHRARVSNEHVWTWLVSRRLGLFMRSAVWSEYSLCRLLLTMKFSDVIQSNPDESSSSDLYGFQLLDRLKWQRMRKVRDFLRFSRLVEKSKIDNSLIKFWVDADRLRFGNAHRKKVTLRAIQLKYYAKTSSYCLPSVFLDAVYPERTVNDCRGFDLERTNRLKTLVLQRLHCYWLPRYLASTRNDITPEEKQKLKKYAAVWGIRHEAQVTSMALHRSQFGRNIQDPDVKFREARQLGSEHEYADETEEERHNILVREISGQEIWEDEPNLQLVKEEGRGRQGSDMLGFENIKYIHEHIFDGDSKKPENEPEINPIDVEKHPILSVKDTYELFPGRIVSAEPEPKSQPDVTVPEMTVSPESADTTSTEYSSDRSDVTGRRSTDVQLWNVEMTQSDMDILDVTPTDGCGTGEAKSLIQFNDAIEEDLLARFHQKSMSPSNVIQHHTASNVFPESRDPARRSKSEVAMPSPRRSPQKRSRVGSVEPIVPDQSKASSCSLPCLPSQTAVSIVSEDVTSSDPASDYDTSCTSASATSQFDDVASGSIGSEHCTAVKDEYLRRVEQGLEFLEVLASDEPAGFPFRKYLGRDVDRAGQGDVGGESVTATPRVLDLWRRIEKMRLSYFKFTSVEMTKELEALRRVFYEFDELRKDDVTSLVAATKNLYNDSIFPETWSQFQRKVEKAMEIHWVKFAVAEQSQFKNAIITTEQRIYPRRHSFPNLPSETRALPILRTSIPENYELKTPTSHGYLSTLGYNGEGHIRYRVSRAYRLLMASCGNDVKHDVRYSEFVGEDSSDEEGNLPPLRPKVFVKLPELDPRTVAKHSASEYPRSGIDYGVYRVFRVVTRHTVDTKPVYMRPIRKHGVLLRRPSERPRNLIELLRDSLHFEFFKRYMKMHKSEAPLLFWKSVELLRRTENPHTRQKKAQQILKKFFGRLAGGGMMLQCDSEVIKEIAVVDTVTTSMLVQASHEVYKSMDKNWTARYFSTFPGQGNPDDDLDSLDGKLGLRAFRTKLNHIWEVFSEFMRRAARFISCMRNPKKFNKFGNYLVQLPTSKDMTTIAGGDASSTAVAFKRFQTIVYKHMNADVQYKHVTKKLFGRKITINFLPNDLAFWLEADRYVSICDNVQQMMLAGCYEERDNELVKEKAERIVHCFLDSHIPPKTRVNIDKEIASAITMNVQKGCLDRGIFHEAVLSVFPVLLYFWKIYRQEEFKYVSRKVQREQHRESVKERHKKQKKKEQRKRRESFEVSRISAETSSTLSQKSSTSTSKFPDYVNGLAKKEQPFERVKGLLHSDPPTLHFTLENGLKLILPPRRRLVDRFGSPESEDDEQLMMNVWTRGAKVVNVIREGSDPKLIDLDERKRGFRVKCDLIEK